jgi:hypothetical protein
VPHLDNKTTRQTKGNRRDKKKIQCGVTELCEKKLVVTSGYRLNVINDITYIIHLFNQGVANDTTARKEAVVLVGPTRS